MNKHSHWLPVARKKNQLILRKDLILLVLLLIICVFHHAMMMAFTTILAWHRKHFIVPLSKCVVCCFLDWGLAQLEDVLQWYLFPLVDQWLVVIFDPCSNEITSGGSESYCHVDNVIFLLTYS
jgi:hypothetical protein